MNETIESFVREELRAGLHQLPENWQFTFKRMYSHDNLNRTIDEVVNIVPEEKLDWALTQVENSLKQLRGQEDKP